MMEKKPELQFWLWVLLLLVSVFVLVGVQATLFLFNHGNDLTSLTSRAQANLVVFLGLALATLLPFLVWGMRIWYRRYVLPLHCLTEDVEALVHGSPNARLVPQPEDPAGLSIRLNALMDRYQHSEERVQHRLEQAMGDLREEKSRLESLLDALCEGVVVFSPDGIITRYNHAAAFLFNAKPELGIGKPVAGLVELSVLEFAREKLTDQLSMRVRRPFVPFHCNHAGNHGDGLQARISPILVAGESPETGEVLEGYLLTVEPEEVSGEAGHPPFIAREIFAPVVVYPDWSARPLDSLRYIVLDTETTGLDPGEGDEIISIGAVAVVDSTIRKEEIFDAFVKPESPIASSATKVHGIREQDLEQASSLTEVLPGFIRFVRNSVLVAHNAAFDLAFLHKAVLAVADEEGAFSQPVLDTMLLSAVLHPNQPSHSLDSLLARYGIAVDGRHSALGDALMTAELLLRLLPQLHQRGIHTLGEAQAASRRTPLAKLSYG